MSAIFCCLSISPYRPRKLDHEAKFEAFMRWARIQNVSLSSADCSLDVSSTPYAIQLVRQINYGPQESIRYFVLRGNAANFVEVTEDDLLKWNFEKVNSYKNFRCEKHNRFFEINLYQKNPTNTHHWRANLARPSRDIDLAPRRMDCASETDSKVEVQGESNQIAREFHRTQSEGGIRPVAPWTRRDEYDDDDLEHDDDSFDYDDHKDFTACDKECGYCGNCDY